MMNIKHKMHKTIVDLLKKHDKYNDFKDNDNFHFRIDENEEIGRERFVIERIGWKDDNPVVSIAFYREEYYDLIADPDVEFVFNEDTQEMIPVAIQTQFYYATADTKKGKQSLLEYIDSFEKTIRDWFLD